MHLTAGLNSKQIGECLVYFVCLDVLPSWNCPSCCLGRTLDSTGTHEDERQPHDEEHYSDKHDRDTDPCWPNMSRLQCQHQSITLSVLLLSREWRIRTTSSRLEHVPTLELTEKNVAIVAAKEGTEKSNKHLVYVRWD